MVNHERDNLMMVSLQFTRVRQQYEPNKGAKVSIVFLDLGLFVFHFGSFEF
jgi:hypothetical protein